MRHVYPSDMREELAFAEGAAAAFAADPDLTGFTVGDIEPGALLALRWGLGRDCVLVLKLDDVHLPTVYAQVIKTA